MMKGGAAQSQGSDPLQKLISMPLADRIAAVSEDVRKSTDEFRKVNPHKLAEALGVPTTKRPNRSDWAFIHYAWKRSLEEYAYECGKLSDCVFLVKDNISPQLFESLVGKSPALDELQLDILTQEERREFEQALAFDDLKSNMDNDTMNIYLSSLQAKDFELSFSHTFMKQNFRIAIYARVSTDDKGQDPLNQLLQLREFAQQQGWMVVAEYTDELSAKNGKRPGFKAMWKAAEAHRFECLLFWSLDRLTREGTFATLQYLRRLSDLGIKFKSYTEQYVDSLGVFGEAIIGILAAVAQQERIRISERTKAGLERVRKRGKKLGRPRLKDLSGASRATIWRRRKAAAGS
jgi:DNA invertase Pin-like site-specific DNA recombinase